MARTRRLTLTAATAAATLVALPTYAAVTDSSASRAHPAATPTRVSSTAPAPSSSTGRSAPDSSASSQNGPEESPTAEKSLFTPPDPEAGVTPSGVPTVTPDNRFEVEAGSPGLASGKSWPDAREVFTESELAQVIPGLTGVEARDCRPSGLDKGKETAHDTRCELALTIKGEPQSVRSRLVVNIRGFGSPEPIGRAWGTALAAKQESGSNAQADLARYTFYRRGALGAGGAYTDGTTARVLVQRPGVAAEIWFSGIGFTQTKPGYLESRKDFRERITPALVRLLAAKMEPA